MIYTITIYFKPGIGTYIELHSIDELRGAVNAAIEQDKPFLVGHQFHTELNVATRKTGGVL
jgi:hypothetical protein